LGTTIGISHGGFPPDSVVAAIAEDDLALLKPAEPEVA
jgi:hypothetical protein